jgi:SPP1 gp7 family putative phage head morphogenesis protein
MPTLNEQIRDFEIRHAVGVQRLSAGTVKRLIKLLDQADREIVKELLSRIATLEGSFTSQRLDFLLRALRGINHDAHVMLGLELRKELRNLARYEVVFQQDLFKRVLPVAFDVITPAPAMLDAIVTSRPFQGRFLRQWVRDLEVGTLNRLRGAVQQGMVQAEPIDQIVRRVRGTAAAGFRDGVMQTSRRHAENLVRTAVNHVSNAARETLFSENADLVKGVQWVATLDTRTCEICMGYDGQVFDMDEGPRPPAHPSCRCATAPVVKSWKELGVDLAEAPEGTRASMDGQVPATLSYNQWLQGQSADVQDEALGLTRGALFRRGGLEVDAFSDSRGNKLNLDELRAREAKAFEKAGIAA